MLLPTATAVSSGKSSSAALAEAAWPLGTATVMSPASACAPFFVASCFYVFFAFCSSSCYSLNHNAVLRGKRLPFCQYAAGRVVDI